MDKDRHYRAYDGLKVANNGNTSSLKRSRDSSKPQPEQIGCLCFGGVPDIASHHSFLKGFMINLGICMLLVAYTFIGSFIFLAIEGDADGGLQQITLPAIASSNQPHRPNYTVLLNEALKAPREQTVKNLWEITEKLNILFRQNWTQLAEGEIIRFQESLITLSENILKNHHIDKHTGMNDNGPIERKVTEYEWNFAKAFLYSLTVLTTVGFGSVGPKSNWGKVATIGYALVGIPLALVYLSSAGGLLSRCARGVFTRALCCCLCSNCGYCCYDERRMQEKERRMKRKRQQEEMNQQQQQQLGLQEPFYVRANASTYPNSMEIKTSPKDEVSSLGSGDRPHVTIFAPISICFGVMLCYIVAGAFALYKLEDWNFIDASYFCFMSLTTIGFGPMVPGSYSQNSVNDWRNITLWFCSCYIIVGMALTAMCFNIIEDEIVHRFSLKNEKQESVKPSASVDELATDPFALTS